MTIEVGNLVKILNEDHYEKVTNFFYEEDFGIMVQTECSRIQIDEIIEVHV